MRSSMGVIGYVRKLPCNIFYNANLPPVISLMPSPTVSLPSTSVVSGSPPWFARPGQLVSTVSAPSRLPAGPVSRSSARLTWAPAWLKLNVGAFHPIDGKPLSPLRWHTKRVLFDEIISVELRKAAATDLLTPDPRRPEGRLGPPD